MEKPINLLIADDSRIHIMGMLSILKNAPQIGVVYQANSYEQACGILEKGHTIDVAILDISMEEEQDGIKLAEHIAKNYPTVRTMILSHYKEAKYILAALKANVRAYLAKDSSPDSIIDAIQSTSHGKGVFFGDTISYKELLDTFGNSNNLKCGKPYELTDKELETLSFIAKGYNSKETAAAMQITTSTVETYKERIKNKLGVKSMIEAFLFGVKHHFIQI
ncbi:MAG: response regulator transcription factor [Bacteroidales bacterium]